MVYRFVCRADVNFIKMATNAIQAQPFLGIFIQHTGQFKYQVTNFVTTQIKTRDKEDTQIYYIYATPKINYKSHFAYGRFFFPQT